MKKIIEKSCDVCGSIVKTPKYGGGRCKTCGWIDDPHQREYPNCKNSNNLVSLNRAKLLWHEGKKLLPDFVELLDMMRRGFEFDFLLHGRKYEVLLDKDDRWRLLRIGTESFQIFDSVDEFANGASIDDIPLSVCWGEISTVDYME